MASLSLTRLTNRSLLKISGPDCYTYLNGLLCNDITCLLEPDKIPSRPHAINSSNSIASFMLNPHGRAICDMIIYKTQLPDELLIECDSELSSGLCNTLYAYRVRKKISMAMLNDLSVWTLYPSYKSAPSGDCSELVTLTALVQSEIIVPDLTIVNDARLTALGARILCHSKHENSYVQNRIQSIINCQIKEASLKSHTKFRYALGIGEGGNDHPESNCLPLECNADYLGYISFTKGCYLGQELNSRIKHTGVVRKRLMPLNVESAHHVPIVGTNILIESSMKKIGTVRAKLGEKGLGLIRHDLLKDNQTLILELNGTKVSTYVPFWWPTGTSTRQ